jgi:hypothetical protein
MPDISIQQSTFERLQRHARPLVDTVDSVINRALDALEDDRPAASSSGEMRFSTPPDVTHTKVLDASIEGTPLLRPNWNRILDEAVRHAMRIYRDFDKVRLLCAANIVQGRKEDEGYGYLPDIDISIQGQDANAACRACVALAQATGLALDIGFVWRQKTGAAFPGVRGRLVIEESKMFKSAASAWAGRNAEQIARINGQH